MKHDPRFQENDVVDYKMKEYLSKLSVEELDKIIEEKKERIKKLPKFSEMQ